MEGRLEERFSLDGHALATIGTGNGVRIWSTDADYVATRLCHLNADHQGMRTTRSSDHLSHRDGHSSAFVWPGCGLFETGINRPLRRKHQMVSSVEAAAARCSAASVSWRAYSARTFSDTWQACSKRSGRQRVKSELFLLRLQRMQASTKFATSCSPPRVSGRIWSTSPSVAGRPQ
jgi:hypothetical protein